MEVLHVFLCGKRVGTLESDKGRLFFTYDDDYRKQHDAIALSYSLPLENKEHRECRLIFL